MRRLSTLARSVHLPLTVFVRPRLPCPRLSKCLDLVLSQVITSAIPVAASTTSRAPAPAAVTAQPPPLSSLPLPQPLKPSLGPTFAYLVDLSLLLTPAEPLFGPVDGKDRTVLEVTRNARGDKGATVVFKLVRPCAALGASLRSPQILTHHVAIAGARREPGAVGVAPRSHTGWTLARRQASAAQLRD